MSDREPRLAELVTWALPIQIGWALLSGLWNLAGVALQAQGQPALGPTASLVAAGLLVALAAGFVLTVRRAPILYVTLSTLAGAAAAYAFLGAFIGDSALWPSAFWRIAGAVLNLAGIIGVLRAIVGFARWRRGLSS